MSPAISPGGNAPHLSKFHRHDSVNRSIVHHKSTIYNQQVRTKTGTKPADKRRGHGRRTWSGVIGQVSHRHVVWWPNLQEADWSAQNLPGEWKVNLTLRCFIGKSYFGNIRAGLEVVFAGKVQLWGKLKLEKKLTISQLVKFRCPQI